MKGNRMQVLRLAIAAVVFGCSVYSYVSAACTSDCRTAYALTTPTNDCRVFEDSVMLKPTFHAWNLVKTYNPINTEKQPADLVTPTVTLNVYNPDTCTWTCGALQNPQEVQSVFQRIRPQSPMDQRKCTAGGS